jgi:pyruvate/2-oxoglutarate dehydrogenase complex dihydrolipoamide acyltransferase (E2) component
MNRSSRVIGPLPPFRQLVVDGMELAGSIPERSAWIGQIQNREHLCLTVRFDHDIVDGAPAVRFSQRLAALIQAGAGLEDAV